VISRLTPTASVTLVALATLLTAPSSVSANDRFDLGLNDVVPATRTIEIPAADAPARSLPVAGLLAGTPDAVVDAASPPSERLTFPTHNRHYLVGGMTTTSWVLTGLFVAGGAAILSNASMDDAEKWGDAVQLFLPASAYAMTWIGHDGRGAGRYSLQLGTGMALTYGVKHVVSKRTPTAADFDSFPSAHTQAAFSGASFIHRRYGPRWGVPAYVLASFTGLSRVKAERHYLDDVIAGMSIALVSGWTFVHPIEERISLNPLLVNGGFGVGLRVAEGSSHDRETPTASNHQLRWRYTWEVGRVTVQHNVVQAPEGAGDEVDFRFRERNNPTATSNLQIDRSLSAHHQISARLAPFEVREEERFRSSVTFGGTTFDHTEVLDTRYLGYDLRLRWRFRLLPDALFQVHTGAGLEVLATRAEIAVQNPPEGEPARTGRGSDLHILPILHLHLGFAPGRFLIYGEADGTSVGSERYLDWTAGLRFGFNRRWELGIAHRRVDWSLSSPEIGNRFESATSNVSIGYRW
jgi:membrane-associated phospholipid phosphatase